VPEGERALQAVQCEDYAAAETAVSRCNVQETALTEGLIREYIPIYICGWFSSNRMGLTADILAMLSVVKKKEKRHFYVSQTAA
jgi:hypothetical protein